MSRRPATVTQADVNRICRGARQAGASRVTVKVGEAEIVIDLGERTKVPTLSTIPPVAPDREIVL